MRMRRLIIQAFGPFADRQVIDFEQMPDDAVFMISGPTGAGKTSILDAISYALYGETSGGERDPSQMRSHHADPATMTEIEFDFDLGAQRYRVRRTPDQTRPAKKSGGRDLVDVSRTAEFHQWDGADWKLKSSRPKEVNEEIARLIGFESDQFRQVIMLPQGKFRDVLTSESGDREKILETLFSTEKYKRLQGRLKDTARELESRAKEKQTVRTTLLEQAAAESIETLKQRIGETGALLADLSRQETELREKDQAAAKALADAQALKSKFTERDEANKALELLVAEGVRMADTQSTLQSARRAQRVEPAHVKWKEVSDQLAEVQKKHDAERLAADGAAQASSAAAELHKQEEARQPQREAATKERLVLEGLREAATKLKEAETALQAAEKELGGAKGDLSVVEAKQAETEKNRSLVHASIERLRPIAVRKESIGLLLEQQRKVLAALAGLESSRTKLAQAQKDESKLLADDQQARQELEKARDRLEQLNAAWRAGQAGRLASHLHNGEPCPVCGSLDHPQPAVTEENVPSEIDLQAAEIDARQLDTKLEKLREEYASAKEALIKIEAEIKVSQESLPDGQPQERIQVSSAIGTLEKELAEADRAIRELGAAELSLKQHDETLVGMAEVVKTARQRLENATGRQAACAAAFNERAGAIPVGYRQGDSLERAIAKAQADETALNKAWRDAQEVLGKAQVTAATAAERLKNAEVNVAEVSARRESARAELAAALEKEGFADEETFLGSRLPGESIDALERLIQDHNVAMAAARERVARAALAVEGLVFPDIDQIAAAHAQAREAVEAIIRLRNSHAERLKSDEQAAEKLAEINTELEAIERRYSVAGRLAEVANGANSQRMTFQRFVLAALLDDVLRQASLRLKVMTQGRYELQRRGSVADARRASGLDLDVYDDYTGRTRPANTLSGGEGFMAALSLALGLSDVVQSYAGGIQLDTLFIDEGFGSLDSDALDLAMKSLMDLRQQGRMVGIISHVDELKRQIGRGIEVTSGLKGSEVKMRL